MRGVPGPVPGREGREDVVSENAEITLVLGGARSGKSELAERLGGRAAAGGPVTYLATGPTIGDPAWLDRLAAHRARRPPGWHTVEVPSGGSLASALAAAAPVALIDSLGTWVAGLEGFGLPDRRPTDRLIDALARRASTGATTIVVSEEVGLGVHPSTAAGGAFRDALGALNRRVAEVATEVLLVVAGRVVRLDVAVGRW